MCGTYSLRKSPREVRARLREGWHPQDIPDDAWHPSYKIKPSQNAPTIVHPSAGAVLMSWGLLPHWAKDQRMVQINAKSETAAEKPMFRASIRHSRCIVLADGFYEPKGKSKPRPWYFFQAPGEELLGFAGIFAEREGKSGFAILTTEPNQSVGQIHDRMPVILKMQDWDDWLNLKIPTDAYQSLYHPDSAPLLDFWAVPDDAKKASSPDGPNCIEPVA